MARLPRHRPERLRAADVVARSAQAGLSYGKSVDEARMEPTEHGMTAATEGWFAVNVRDAA
jgi:hypothetical protein